MEQQEKNEIRLELPEKVRQIIEQRHMRLAAV